MTQNAAIFGRLFFDSDADGSEQAGLGGAEVGVADQTVLLLDASGFVIRSVLTNGSGGYAFTGLDAGDYAVQASAGAGGQRLIAAGAADPDVDSDGDPSTGRTALLHLGIDQQLRDIDFGYGSSPEGPADLAAVQNATTLAADNGGVVCFVRGTRILTAEGEKGIENLTAGDLVRTMDHGYQPIRWIGSSIVEGKGRFAPIVIEADTLGNARRLAVSPQHRMLLTGWQAELYFDEPEVLVAAKMLVNDTTIRVQEQAEVEYFHMLFDTHEIIFAEGAPSESFHPAHIGWGALAESAREEILALFPELEGLDFSLYGPSARRSLTAKEARLARDTIIGGSLTHAAE